MQTVELTDVYKASAEVASLGSSDKLMVTDANGVQKRITKDNLKDNLTFTSSAEKWHRILTLGAGGVSSAGMLAVVSSSTEQESFILKWNVMRTAGFNKSCVEIFNPGVGYGIEAMPKIRLLRPSSSGYPAYVDVYLSKEKTVKTAMCMQINASFSLVTDAPIPTSPCAYNVTEIDMTVLGGGKRLFVNKLRNLAERRAA